MFQTEVSQARMWVGYMGGIREGSRKGNSEGKTTSLYNTHHYLTVFYPKKASDRFLHTDGMGYTTRLHT
jgi:hypothetical protein